MHPGVLPFLFAAALLQPPPTPPDQAVALPPITLSSPPPSLLWSTAEPFIVTPQEVEDILWQRGLIGRRLNPDGQDWTLDLRIAWNYNADLDNADSIPECFDVLARSPYLLQGLKENPIAIGQREADRYNRQDADFWRRLGEAAVYMLRSSGDPGAAEGAALLFMKGEEYVLRDLALDFGAEYAIKPLDKLVGRAKTDGNEIALDIGVHSVTSYDSLSSIRRLILNADRRNVGAIVVADHDTMAGALRVQRLADDLKRQGLIRPDFVVIVGEDVTTREGRILALFINDLILPGMTARQAIEEIHRQGGLAILADPAAAGGTKLATAYPIDGYVARPGLRRFYRTLRLQDEPALASKPLFYTTSTHYSHVIEGVYTIVETPDHTPQGIKRAILDGLSYPHGNAYWPVLGIVSFKPISQIEKTLNYYFEVKEGLEGLLARLIGADNVRLRVSWTEDFNDLMDLRLIGTTRAIAHGRATLNDGPRLRRLTISYGPVILGYDSRRDLFSLHTAFTF